MPYVTEELWQRLPSSRDQTVIESIMMCKYPSIVEGWRNKRVEYDMDLVDSAVKSLRSLANERRESENDVTTAGCAVSVVNENLSVYLELQGTLSPKVEFEKYGQKWMRFKSKILLEIYLIFISL
ncbi:valine--trna ligase [Quercus suber]|uniref:valine--tRNA ligase n=1 Tax=Quercus suber TaxID=58331 RepID=A0AAW0KE75_QUESU